MPLARHLLARLATNSIVLFARIVTAVRGLWVGIEPRNIQRVYFANHSSHGDFVLLWTVLPPYLRTRTRPVAAAEYWQSSSLKKFIGTDVFNALLIERDSTQRSGDPVSQMSDAIDQGDSLILFPEGTRNTSDATLLPFKSGLYHLALARPEIDLVPVWIANLNRVLPKGEVLPVPLICTVTFGTPLHVEENETKVDFLARAEHALLSLSESPNASSTPEVSEVSEAPNTPSAPDKHE